MTQAVLALQRRALLPGARWRSQLTGLQAGAGQRVPGGARPGHEHRLPGLRLADPGRFCHAVRARAPGVGLAGASDADGAARRTMALSSNRKTMDSDREFEQLKEQAARGCKHEHRAMTTTTLTLHEGFLVAPQLASTGCSPCSSWPAALLCLRALRRVHGRLREGHPAGRRAGRDLARLVLAAAARADARWSPRRRCWPSPPTRASLARADSVFWLKYFLSSQSRHPVDERAVLHEHGVLLDRHVRRAGRATRMELIGSRLAWVGRRAWR